MFLFKLNMRYTKSCLTFAGKNSKDCLLCVSGPGVYDIRPSPAKTAI